MEVVDRIFDLVQKKKIEQKEFATLIGTTDKVVSAWRRGRTKSYTKYLPQIAEALDTSVEYLMTGTEAKKEPTGNADGLSAEEADLLELFRGLSDDEQDLVVRMVQAAARRQKG